MAETSARDERRQRHQELGRTHLLDAAEEVFGRRGFHEATLKQVAELAEFSVGSVYSFFESKDDLFRQIFNRRGGEFMPGLREIVGDANLDPREQLHALADFEVGFFRAHPRFGRLFLRYSTATPLTSAAGVDEVMRKRYEEAMRLQADVFERGRQTGLLRDGDPVVLARLFSGLVSAFQSVDPAVISDDPDAVPLSLDQLHAIVRGAFESG